MRALKEIIESFEDLTVDIADVLYKPDLKMAIVAAIESDTDLPRSFINEVVDMIYRSEDC